jgi:hypothetical protein
MSYTETLAERNALFATIHSALVDAEKKRRLTDLERRIRRMIAPKPWRADGITRSSWYRRRARTVITANIPRIEPDPPGGWFVVRGDHGWLYGSRSEAVRAARELADEVRP